MTTPNQNDKRKAECHEEDEEETMKWSIFDWSIDEISTYMNNGLKYQCLKSFILSDEVGNCWQLKCYPGGYSEESDGFVSVFLKNMNPQKEITVTVGWSIFNPIKNKFTNYKEDTNTFSELDFGYENFLSHADLFAKNSKYVIKDAIKFRCRITYVEENPSSRAKVARSNYFGTLFQKRATDVKFVVGNEEFAAHKVVLARSTVFSEMFDDGRRRNFKIDHCDPVVFEAMLRFMYTDEIDEDNLEMVQKLMPIATRFKCNLLLLRCKEVFLKNF